MSTTLINIGVYHPFRAAEMAPRFGLTRPVSATGAKEPDTEESQQKTNNDSSSPVAGVDRLELSSEAMEIRELQMRDREVRAHEAAHAAAGGSYAGTPSYSYERGPDGRTYAVGGSVSIDMSPIPGDPQATLQKAQQIRAAALAPAQPSAQDMKVAQKAQTMAAQARGEMSQLQAEERQQQLHPEQQNPSGMLVAQGLSAYSRGISNPGSARLEAYS